jgi:hypothetical protein
LTSRAGIDKLKLKQSTQQEKSMSNENQPPFSGLSNSKRYRARIRPVPLPTFDDNEWIEVASTTNSPDSSYGLQCWVSQDGVSYGQITLHNPLYELADIREVSDEEADAWLEG